MARDILIFFQTSVDSTASFIDTIHEKSIKIIERFASLTSTNLKRIDPRVCHVNVFRPPKRSARTTGCSSQTPFILRHLESSSGYFALTLFLPKTLRPYRICVSRYGHTVARLRRFSCRHLG